MAGPRLTRDSLIQSFHDSGKPRERWLVGAEFERHLLLADGAPLPYGGEPGVRWLMERLIERGWVPYHEGPNPIALSRGSAQVTLEPGAQFELSGSAGGALQEVADEARRFAEEVDDALDGTDVRQVALGFTPFARIEDVPWVPKGRYQMMREHLARTGALAHHMMKGTCAVQASYDYADEADCARKVQLATQLGPLTTAMFANSPLAEGRPSGFMSWRGHIWTQTDPRRTGFPEAAESFSFERWVDYLLDVPMMFYQDPDGNWRPAHGRTFAEWMRDPDHPPGPEAWELHLTSAFPEVRVKRTIEVRGADCVPLPLAMSFVSLFKGLFYCELALQQATALAQRFASHGTKGDRFAVACRDGLEGELGGRRLADWAEELLLLSDEALQRCAPEDRPWLRPLMAQVETGVSPARTLLERLGGDLSPERVLEETDILGRRSTGGSFAPA